VKVWVYPHGFERWYYPKLRVVMETLGWKVGSSDDHDLRIFFCLHTLHKNNKILKMDGKPVRDAPTTSILPKTINGSCTDTRKSHVDSAFKKVFGYGTKAEHGEDCLVKPEAQAMKTFVESKSTGRPHYFEQRKIDTKRSGMFVDLRPVVFDGKIEIAFVKRKPNMIKESGSIVTMVEASTVFFANEIGKLEAFCASLGLDYGEIDVLREKGTGRIYVVDANPTPSRDAFLAIGNQLGKTTERLVQMRYASLFEKAFNTEKWLIR